MGFENRGFGLIELKKYSALFWMVKLGVALFSIQFFCDSVEASSTAVRNSESQSPVKKEGPRSWKDPSREECAFGCLYEKANENIGLQFKYIRHKIKALAEASPDQQKKALGSFCRENEETGDCFKRYIKLQVYVMRKMHGAMVQNYHSAAMISNSKNATEKTRPYVMGLVPEGEAKKERQAPYVVTFEDLKKDYAEMIRLGGNDFKRWAEQLPSEPSKEDFAKFEEIPRDPNHPNAGTFLVLARDKNGEIQYNKKAYEAALSRYNSTVRAELTRAGIGTSQNGLGQPANRQLGSEKRSSDLETEVGSLNKRAFAEAEKFQVEFSVTAGGNGAVQSQKGVDYEKGDPKQPRSSSATARAGQSMRADTGSGTSSKREVKEMLIDELKHQGVTSLFHSPEAMGKYIDQLEKEIDSAEK